MHGLACQIEMPKMLTVATWACHRQHLPLSRVDHLLPQNIRFSRFSICQSVKGACACLACQSTPEMHVFQYVEPPICERCFGDASCFSSVSLHLVLPIRNASLSQHSTPTMHQRLGNRFQTPTRQKYEKKMAPKLWSLPCCEAFGVIFCPDFCSYLPSMWRGGGSLAEF